jgi:hypothetical protein
MDRVRGKRRYEAGDAVKLEIVLHHRANLREVRVLFEHPRDKTAAPLMARGQPRPISERGTDGSVRSCLDAEIVIPRAVVPGIYELTRISYETAGGQLGHLEEGEDLSDVPHVSFEVIGEPADTPNVVDIAFADSKGGWTGTS